MGSWTKGSARSASLPSNFILNSRKNPFADLSVDGRAHQNMLEDFCGEALHISEFVEPYSDGFLRKNKLFGLKEALKEVHFLSPERAGEGARTHHI